MPGIQGFNQTASYDFSGKGVSLTIGEGGKMGIVDSNGNSLSLQDLLKIGDQKNTEDPEMTRMEDLRKIAYNSGCRDTMNQMEAMRELKELEKKQGNEETVINMGCRDLNSGCRDTMNQMR